MLKGAMSTFISAYSNVFSVVFVILVIAAIHFVRPAHDITIEVGGSPDQTFTAILGVETQIANVRRSHRPLVDGAGHGNALPPG